MLGINTDYTEQLLLLLLLLLLGSMLQPSTPAVLEGACFDLLRRFEKCHCRRQDGDCRAQACAHSLVEPVGWVERY